MPVRAQARRGPVRRALVRRGLAGLVPVARVPARGRETTRSVRPPRAWARRLPLVPARRASAAGLARPPAPAPVLGRVAEAPPVLRLEPDLVVATAVRVPAVLATVVRGLVARAPAARGPAR